jgi:hypothetical protein
MISRVGAFSKQGGGEGFSQSGVDEEGQQRLLRARLHPYYIMEEVFVEVHHQ